RAQIFAEHPIVRVVVHAHRHACQPVRTLCVDGAWIFFAAVGHAGQTGRIAPEACLTPGVFVVGHRVVLILEGAVVASVALFCAVTTAVAVVIVVAIVVGGARLTFFAALHAGGNIRRIVLMSSRKTGGAGRTLDVIGVTLCQRG